MKLTIAIFFVLIATTVLATPINTSNKNANSCIKLLPTPAQKNICKMRAESFCAKPQYPNFQFGNKAYCLDSILTQCLSPWTYKYYECIIA